MPMTFDKFRAKYNVILSEQQEAAVRSTEQNTLLLAVPGSGKTTVLVTRIGYMLYACDIMPERILTMTYTNAATHDMIRRFESKFGDEFTKSKRLEFRTINGICAKIILFYEYVTKAEPLRLLSNEKEIASILGAIYRGITNSFMTENDVKQYRLLIARIKNEMLKEAGIQKLAEDEDQPDLPKIYKAYQEELARRGAMDYDDQMVRALQILRENPNVLARYTNRYKYICVDEAQDTSRIQHEIIRMLTGKTNRIFMVGDEDQSIYGFRAAYPQALMEFELNYPDARVLFMETNYRSVPEIVDASQKFISRNTFRRKKHMAAFRNEHGIVQEIPVQSRSAQYSYILGAARNAEEETAVLYRDNDSIIPVIDLLEREGMTYRLKETDATFFSHPIVRDICGMLTFAANKTDRELFLQLYYKFIPGLKRKDAERICEANDDVESLFETAGKVTGIPRWIVGKCEQVKRELQEIQKGTALSAIRRITEQLGYREYLRSKHMDPGRIEILKAIAEREKTPADFLARIRHLETVVRKGSTDKSSNLILSTIHSSKGLEYKNVYLLDVIDGILPKQERGSESKRQKEEERRLFYVAATRAKDRLYVFTFWAAALSYSFGRELIQYTKPPAAKGEQSGTAQQTSPARTRKQLFGQTKSVPPPSYRSLTERIGSRQRMIAVNQVRERIFQGSAVVHSSFGNGEVQNVDENGIASIRFNSGEKRIDLVLALEENIIAIR